MPYWIYGIHTVKAALENPQRRWTQLVLTSEVYPLFEPFLQEEVSPKVRIKKRQDLEAILGEGTVHQGCALKVDPLPSLSLDEVIQEEGNHLILALDQVTDPHNVGSLLRSCAAFGVSALMVPKDHAVPEESSVFAKTASGATEIVPVLRVPNLVRALESLKSRGYYCTGLDEMGETPLLNMEVTGRNILVLGSEGKGLRPLTRRTCDFLVNLPTSSHFPTLNVSVAGAIALYHFSPLRHVL